MANWSNPQLTSTYTNFVTEVKDRDVDLALQFDGTTSTNIPTNAIRWNSSISRWQKWSGSAWGELTSTYALNALSVSGTTSLATATATTVATGDNSTNIATTAWVKAQNYLTSVGGSFLPLTGGTITGDLSVAGTFSANTTFIASGVNGGAFGFKNKVINGDFAVDQYNFGALVNPINNYFIDRWAYAGPAGVSIRSQQNLNAITPPTFFNTYLGLQNNTAYTVASGDNAGIQHRIEGYNVANWGWGASGSRDAMLSFWVRTSVSGTYGLSLQNGTTPSDYSYVTSFTIAAGGVNTWQRINLKIPGPTGGTWSKDSGIGIRIRFNLGCGTTFQTGTTNAWQAGNLHAPTGAVSWVGTANATFYITGVQLEDSEATNSLATDFEDPPFPTKLIRCQRYFCKTFNYSTKPAQNAGRPGAIVAASAGDSLLRTTWAFPVEMRAAPTITTFNPNVANANWRSDSNLGDPVPATPLATGTRSTDLGSTAITVLTDNTYLIHATASAEL